MLIDPFYKPGAKYSGSSTGILLVDASAYVGGASALTAAFIAAGWSIVDNAPGVAVQTRPAFYFDVSSGSGTPREMTAAECTGGIGPLWKRVSVGAITYIAYDPFVYTPTCAGGTGSLRWYEEGGTSLATADNLASKISEDPIFSATVSDVIGDPSAGGLYEFTLTAKVPAFEFDDISIRIGGGTDTSKRGSYTLRSPALPSGAYLEVKIETRIVGNLGGFFIYDGVGDTEIFLTVTASGGGTYEQPFHLGGYFFCGCESQALIWPNGGASSLLVSLIQAPVEHNAAGDCVLVVGSDNGDLNVNHDHLQEKLWWSASLATGHNESMDDTAYLKGSPDGYQIVPLLVRGTRGRQTVSLAGQPLVQAPYVALPANPTDGPEAVIVGKFWDMVTTSGNATPGATMMHDGKPWTCISTSLPVGDVGCDLWILRDAG